MNKRELIKWIDSKEQECLKAIGDVAKSATEAEKGRIIEQSGLKELLKEFYITNSDWFERFDALIESNEDIKSASQFYYSVLGELKSLSSNSLDDVLKMVKKDMDYRTINSLKRIENQRKEARDKVTSNYIAVRENVRRCSTAKIAVEYLKELGFDVPDKKSKDKPQLPAVPVDARYLFVSPQVKSHE